MSHSLGPDGIIPGAEPLTFERKGAPAVLLIHGGGDTPQAMRELAEHLHRAGFAVRVPLLARHGRVLREMRLFDADEWRAQVRLEYDDLQAIHPRAAVVGISVGGALAVELAAERSPSALVLLAPYVAMPGPVRLVASLGWLWGAIVRYLPSGSRASIRDPAAAAQTLGRGVTTPAALRAFRTVADRADAALSRVTTPTLLIQSKLDNRLPMQVAECAFAKLGAKEKSLVWLDDAGHVVTVDFGKDRVFALTAEWLKQHLG